MNFLHALVHKNKYFASVNALINYQTELAISDGVEAASSAEQAKMMVIIFLLAGIIISMVLAFVITRGIVTPVKTSISTADNLAKGNLRIDIDTNRSDETGDLLKAMKSLAGDLLSLNSDVENLTVAAINGKLDNRRKGHIAQALAIPVMNNAVGNANTASVIKDGVRRNNAFS